MIRAVLVILPICFCWGCQHGPAAGEATPAEAALVAEERPASDPQPAVAEPAEAGPAIAQPDEAIVEKIFLALTANSWTGLPPNRPAFPPMDYSVASYRADGTWSFEFFTDYHIPAEMGKWNLQFVQGQWYLCRDDGARGAIGLNDDRTIKLGFGKFYPHEPLKREPGQKAAKLPKLVLVPEVQEIVRRLTAHKWKRANDMDLFMEPTLVEFRPDWTFAATYRGGECTSAGTWYATAKEIGAHSPTGRCDRPSDNSSGDWLTAQVIDDGRILVNWDLYVPESEPLPRGILWALFGYSDVVRIRIEYDMPIRRGVPAAFDVTFTNLGSEPLTLERFSLTREYSNYGRSVGDRGKKLELPGDEVVAHDLAGKVLQTGESHSFRLNVTFPEAGQPGFYFNALVSGTSQNWDTHQSHWPTVAE